MWELAIGKTEKMRVIRASAQEEGLVGNDLSSNTTCIIVDRMAERVRVGDGEMTNKISWIMEDFGHRKIWNSALKTWVT